MIGPRTWRRLVIAHCQEVLTRRSLSGSRSLQRLVELLNVKSQSICLMTDVFVKRRWLPLPPNTVGREYLL